MSIIRQNAEKDSSYRPYCMPCPGLIRMQCIEPFYWKCRQCGSEYDERTPEERKATTRQPLPYCTRCAGRHGGRPCGEPIRVNLPGRFA